MKITIDRAVLEQAIKKLHMLLLPVPAKETTAIMLAKRVSVQATEVCGLLQEALAQPQPQPEPVAWLPSAEWTACVKLPVTVHVRQQRPGETHVSTREGITPVKPDDLIMRGVSGEEYPIGREIFERTYRIGEYHPAPKPSRSRWRLLMTLA